MQQTLTLDQPVDAGARLHDAVQRLAGAELDVSAAALPRVLACLACGRADRVRALLRDPAPVAALLRQPASVAALPLVLARYVAWTGDLVGSAAAWDAVRTLVADDAAPTGDDAEALLMAAGAAELHHTARDLGDALLAARLRAVHQLALVELDSRRTRGLQPAARALDALLGTAATSGAHADALTRTGASPEADADAPAMAAGAVDGSGDDDAAAATVLRMGHGLLGLGPDAPRHRLLLRPRLPHGARDLAARNIAVGDDLVAVTVRCEPGLLTCRLEQDAGPIPMTALLEPYLPARPLRARIDGRPAELTPRLVGRDFVLPVQLVLDHARLLEVELEVEA
jgi:hypothetical protein